MSMLGESQKAPSTNRTPRRRAREFALQAVYQWLQSGESLSDAGAIDAHIRDIKGFDKADTAYFDTLFHGAIKAVATSRAAMSPFLDRGLSELSPVEHAILLLASYELAQHIEIPYRVVINEAVEIAKAYGGADGFKYVNGVLDKLAAEIRSVEIKAAI